MRIAVTSSAPEPPDDDPVVALLEQCLLRVAVEGSSAVDDVCRANPEHAAALRDGLRFLRRERLVADDADAVPERFGEFRLLHRLGGGGMGVVYLAEQPSLQRTVALKVIRSDLLWFEGSRARFRREAAAIASLQHPAIVPVHAAGDADGIPFLVMDHVAGASLAAVLGELAGSAPERLGVADLAAALQRAARLPAAPSLPFAGPWWRIAGALVAEVASALAHAHERDVLHRDVKPSNVMLRPDGHVQLIDFGLARAGGDVELTRPGTPLGSLAYMAPEQVLGRADIDARCDVYGVGVTLYELLTLHSPFLAGDGESTRARILAADVVAPRRRNRTLPHDLEVVCLQAMAPEPQRRYQTMAGFARDLDAALAHAPITARRAGPWLRLVRFRRRHPATAPLLAALLAVAPIAIWLTADWYRSRAAVRLSESAAQAAELARQLQRGWTTYRTMPARAQEHFAAALRLAPQEPLAVLGVCLVAIQTRDVAGLHRALERHRAVVAVHPMFSLLPAMLAFDASAPFPLPDDAAIPPSPVDWFLVGLAARQRGELGDRDALVRARDCFEQCIHLSPTPEFVFFASRCETLLSLGERGRAEQVVQVLTARWPDSACALAHAASLLKKHDPQRARQLLEAALRLDANELFAWVQLGRLCMMEGDRTGYLAAIERALALRPDAADLRTERARARLVVGDAAGALADSALAVRDAPDDADALVVHGSALADTGQHDAAFAAWQRAETMAPRSPEPTYFRAQLLIELQRYREAVDALRRGIALTPDNPILHGSLAIASRRGGDFAGARAAAARAIELDPGFTQSRLELAFAQWQLGDLAAAKDNLQRVVQEMPDHAEAHAVRERFASETGDVALQAEEAARWQQRQRR